jgi:hypothetical protein
MPHRLLDVVARRAAFRCEYCLAPEVLFNIRMEVEHIYPLARGGADDFQNLALACRACNGFKHTAITARDPLTGRLVRLFNPRTDVWHEQFRLDFDTARIEGRTDIGRATVTRLRMNSQEHVGAREFWMLHFGFPDDAPEAPAPASEQQ